MEMGKTLSAERKLSPDIGEVQTSSAHTPLRRYLAVAQTPWGLPQLDSTRNYLSATLQELKNKKQLTFEYAI